MKTILLVFGISLLALVIGCHTPKHSNVLVFATNTKFGVDISYDPKTQEPSFVVGYRRQEGVWMPLLANYGPDGLSPGPLTITNSTEADPDLQHIAPQMLYQGNSGNNRDTYSVLATFRGKAAAQASRTNGASTSIAQYFATGLAARELAQQGGAALVSTKAASPQNGEAVARYILEPNHQATIVKLNDLRKKKLTSDQTIGAKTYTKDSSAADYADALAAEKGDTLFNIENNPSRSSDLQEIISKLQEATK